MSAHDREPSVNSRHIAPLVGRRISDVERDLIHATLARCGGNRGWAAEILGLSHLALRDKLLAFASDGDVLIQISDEEERADANLDQLHRFDTARLTPS